jgi:23S rRNA (adenine2503-C2)-methyltransferase
MTKKHLIGFDLDDLKQDLKTLDIPSYRAEQIYHWMYHRGVSDFTHMGNLPATLRDTLQQHYTLERPGITQAQASVDGTQKWLLKFEDGNEAETVHIPEKTRGTLCISSQVGCVLTCTFCHTGTQKYVRNLTAGEILGQIMVARDIFGEWPAPQEGRHVSNIVFMGMGEPLYNYENVAKSLKIAMDPVGMNFSKRRITLSTSGVVPMIQRCGEELGVNLAISLHAVRDELRDVLVPLNKKYPLKDLLKACADYPGTSKSNRITFEYVMLKGVNDTQGDARELVRLLKGIHAKVNLIPFNPWPDTIYERSTQKSIDAFANILVKAGYSSPIRRPRGEDILAACGQLKSLSMPQRKSKLDKGCGA